MNDDARNHEREDLESLFVLFTFFNPTDNFDVGVDG
jgi:hypothetical protein